MHPRRVLSNPTTFLYKRHVHQAQPQLVIQDAQSWLDFNTGDTERMIIIIIIFF
jgi:hypothetical protein